MDTILGMTTIFLSSICFSLLPTDVAWYNIFLFCSCRVIALAFFLEKWCRSPTIRGGGGYLLFGSMDNALLHAPGHSPADKIEERITFALSYARLYLAESDDERDENSAAANTFYISCGGGGYSYSLSAITFYV